jgi:hypothetical protein
MAEFTGKLVGFDDYVSEYTHGQLAKSPLTMLQTWYLKM